MTISGFDSHLDSCGGSIRNEGGSLVIISCWVFRFISRRGFGLVSRRVVFI
jgi:hypothetical protein